MKILIVRKTETIRYAAEELAKYLNMMDGTEAKIIDFGEADIKLGLFADFGLPSDDVDDAMLDDVVEININQGKGYISGSNERSVLMGVYTYLKSGGCRWVRPGDKGEYIPKKDMSDHSLSYRKKADYPFRGQCIEGAIGFEHVRDTVLWLPKVNMNLFMIEQIIPYNYMHRWYRHNSNTKWQEEEPPYSQYADWCIQLEKTIKKCGLQLHVMGHGALNEPFGIRHMISGDPYDIPEETKKAFALVKGKRELYKSSPFFTQLCMSQEWVQDRVVNWLADYLEEKPYIDFLHFWLADSVNNHCECEDCIKHTPSDLYVQMLNKLDALLTERGNPAKIIFIMYTDTLWAPIKEKLNNPRRFIMTTACHSVAGYSDEHAPERQKWERNNYKASNALSHVLNFVDDWKRAFDGPKFLYEYYLYTSHFADPGYMFLSRRIAKNVKKLHLTGFDGIMSDQTQRAYFPTALPDTVIGEFLFDTSLDIEGFIDSYIKDCYGEDHLLAKEYLEALSNAFEYDSINTKKSIVAEDTGAPDKLAKKAAIFGDEALGDRILGTSEMIDKFAETVEKNLASVTDKCHKESWKLLSYHGEYCKRFARILHAMSRKDEALARERLAEAMDYLSDVEREIHPYLDVHLFECRIKTILK